MILIIPIGHDVSVRRFPWVTVGVMAICVVLQVHRTVSAPDWEEFARLEMDRERLREGGLPELPAECEGDSSSPRCRATDRSPARIAQIGSDPSRPSTARRSARRRCAKRSGRPFRRRRWSLRSGRRSVGRQQRRRPGTSRHRPPNRRAPRRVQGLPSSSRRRGRPTGRFRHRPAGALGQRRRPVYGRAPTPSVRTRTDQSSALHRAAFLQGARDGAKTSPSRRNRPAVDALAGPSSRGTMSGRCLKTVDSGNALLRSPSAAS